MQLPSTQLDKRIEEQEVFIFDACALQAGYLTGTQPNYRWNDLQTQLRNFRDDPRRLEELSRKGIDQLLAKIDFIEGTRTIIAPRQIREFKEQVRYQKARRKNERTLYERQFGAVQSALYNEMLEREEVSHSDHDQFLVFIDSIIHELEQTGEAHWVKNFKAQRPSPVDKSILAAAAAHAYDGTKTTLFTRDISIHRVARKLPSMLGQPSGKLIVAQSPFSDVNGASSIYIQ